MSPRQRPTACRSVFVATATASGLPQRFCRHDNGLRPAAAFLCRHGDGLRPAAAFGLAAPPQRRQGLFTPLRQRPSSLPQLFCIATATASGLPQRLGEATQTLKKPQWWENTPVYSVCQEQNTIYCTTVIKMLGSRLSC